MRLLPPLALLLLRCDAIGSATRWHGPRVEVVQGSGLPAFKITNPQDNSTELLPLVYLVGGSPSLMGPKEPKEAGAETRMHREAAVAASKGMRIVSAILSYRGYASSPEIMPDGTLSAETMPFLNRLMASAPNLLLVLRIRLDLMAPEPAGAFAERDSGAPRPGSVVMQSLLNASHTKSDWTSSPTRAWAARLGNVTSKVMRTVDAAFPGRLLGVQILHGVTYEGNYPGAWSAASVEGLPAGSYDHMWPDYSPDAMADYCSSDRQLTGAAATCTIPTAAERNRPNLGSTLITADTAVGAAAIDYNRFINLQMARGIAAVGAAIKETSEGNAFVTTVLGGAMFNGAAYETAGGGAAETEFLGLSGFDGVGNPPVYTPDSRSDAGTMQPQAPWDSPLVHGKVYVIEYDLRTYLDAPPGNTPAAYDFLQTLEETADLILHDFCAAAIRGHGLYILDAKASTFVNSAPHSDNNGTVAIWGAVQTAVGTAALFKRDDDDNGLAAEVAVFVDDLSSAHWPLEISHPRIERPLEHGMKPPTTTTTTKTTAPVSSHDGSRGIPGWPDLTLGMVPETFAPLPFPVRYHLLSDLLSSNFTASRIKLAILLNPVRISEDLATAIKQKLQVDGKTVLYSAGVAVVDGNGRRTEDGGRKLTGLTGLVQGADPATGSSSTSITNRRTTFAAPGAGWASAAAEAAWRPLEQAKESVGADWPVRVERFIFILVYRTSLCGISVCSPACRRPRGGFTTRAQPAGQAARRRAQRSSGTTRTLRFHRWCGSSSRTTLRSTLRTQRCPHKPTSPLLSQRACTAI
jgi:hypothetical protein